MQFYDKYLFGNEYEECNFGFHYSLLFEADKALTPFCYHDWQVGKKSVARLNDDGTGICIVPLEYFNPFGFYEIQLNEWFKYSPIPVLLSILEYSKSDIIVDYRQVGLFRPLNRELPMSFVKSEVSVKKANIVHEITYSPGYDFSNFYHELPAIIDRLRQYTKKKIDRYNQKRSKEGKELITELIRKG